MKKRILSLALALVLCLGLAAPALAANDFVIQNGVLVEYTGNSSVVTIPSGVREIGPRAFKEPSEETNLVKVIIPEGVTTIQDEAFLGCYELTEVELPSTLRKIGKLAFWGCESLPSIEIPEGVTTIGDYAFQECWSLADITVPASVTSIGTGAFEGCVTPASFCCVLDSYANNWALEQGDAFIIISPMTEQAQAPASPVMSSVKVKDRNIISAGYNHTAAIDEDGSLWMWGCSYWGELGNDRQGNDNGGLYNRFILQTIPVKVLDDVVSVSLGGDTSSAIKADGSLWMWGVCDYGVEGMGNTRAETSRANSAPGELIQTVPFKVMDDVVAVSCGGDSTAAIKTDGSLWMWGDNSCGQLGNGGEGNVTTKYQVYQTVPIKVMDDVVAVNCGSYHTAAIKADGSLWMWGSNGYGQLGNGTTEESTVPVKVMDNVAAVSCEGSNTAAIKTDGSLWTWGDDWAGRLGNGSGGGHEKNAHGARQTVPIKVMDDVAAVSCGGGIAAIKEDGSLWMWGSNGSGQLGNGGVGNEVYTSNSGQKTTIQTIPVKVMDDVAAVNCGGSHTIAIKTDGSLWTWGDNWAGQLGNGQKGSYNSTNTPARITLGGGASMSKGVRLVLNGGTNGGVLWTDPTKSIQVPTNPTREGYTFGGWYTDAALTIPWNFNDKVVNTLVLYAKWVPVSSTASTTGKSQSTITLNGGKVTLDAYVLKAANGGDVTYVKLRDVAALLDGTKAKFNVDWRRGAIYVDTGKAYTTKNGTELKAISGTDGSYKWNTAPVLFDGTTKALEGIVLTDGQGGGHTFFKLRDLGQAIGFTVGWSAQEGIYIETD